MVAINSKAWSNFSSSTNRSEIDWPALVAVAAWRNGNQEAGDSLYKRYRNFVTVIVADRLNTRYRSRVSVEEVVQDVFLDIFKSLRNSSKHFETENILKNWIGGIAKRTTISVVEYHERQKRSVRRETSEDVMHVQVAPSFDEAQNDKLDLLRRLRDAIETELTPDERKLCNDIWFRNTTQEELAKASGVVPRTIRRRKTSILNKLRVSLN